MFSVCISYFSLLCSSFPPIFGVTVYFCFRISLYLLAFQLYLLHIFLRIHSRMTICNFNLSWSWSKGSSKSSQKMHIMKNAWISKLFAQKQKYLSTSFFHQLSEGFSCYTPSTNRKKKISQSYGCVIPTPCLHSTAVIHSTVTYTLHWSLGGKQQHLL